MIDSIFPVLISNAAKLPLLLLYLVAFILSLLHWRRGGAIAKLAALGFALLLAEWSGRAGLMYWLVSATGTGSAQDRIPVTMVLQAATDLVQFLGMTLIAAAIFVRGGFGDLKPQGREERLGGS